jgi:serine/threonine-protein kinase
LTEVLAEGHLATVYLTTRGEPPAGDPAVLKLYQPNAPVLLARALREGAAQARVQHPRVALLLDQGTLPSGEAYLVSELVSGQTLRADLDARAERHMSWPEAARVAVEIAEGLEAIHRCGLVHRDLKPENVMLEGDARGAKILDLGHALLLDAGRLTESGLVWGSAAYMSPEQAAGNPVDGRSDLYALGVVLYEMLTGRRPFEAKAAVDIMRMHQSTVPLPPVELVELPAPLSDMCLWLLRKQPGQRPASARVARAALQGVLASARREDRGPLQHTA